MHRRSTDPWWRSITRRLTAPVVAAIVAVLAIGGVAAVAVSTAPSGPISCPADLVVHQGGTWECGPAPTTSPTGSPSPSPSPSTTSPSPTPSTTTPTPTPTSSSPSPTPTTTSSGPCPVAGKNVPGGADPWGGCFPGPGNTGVPAGTVLTDYTGPCTITVANTVIDAKRVTCSPLVINAANVKITRSFFDKGFINVGTGSVAVSDTNISMPSYDGTRGECCIADHDYTVTRTEFVGAYRGALCDHNCTVTDSWVHGQLPWAPTGQHASAIREGTRGTFVHNSLACDWPKPDDNSTLGCSGDLVGYPDQLVATVRDNTISRNLFVSTAGVLVSDGNRPVAVLAYCLYAGGSGSTNQKITENVFQKGQFGKCGDFGPVDAYNAGGSGNVFSGNRWDDGTIVTP